MGALVAQKSPNRVSLPRFHVRVGLHIDLFEDCSAFTHVAACTLARSPYVVTAIRRLQTLRLLHVCSGRFRLERSPGGPCTHWKSAALSRRTWRAVLALLPDSSRVAFEPLNEPPNCTEGNEVWDAAQLSLYHQIRTLRRAVKFVVYGHHWGDNVGTDFTSLDPTPYLGDINILFTFHYYDPFAFTGQGLSWLLDGRYRYLTGLTWP